MPEIGEDLPEKNPLLRVDDGLPEFSALTIEKCMVAVGKQAINFENGVQDIENELKNCNSSGPETVFRTLEVFDKLEELAAPLELTWGLAKTLYLGNQSLMPTKSYLSIHERAMRARTSRFNSKEIYNTIKNANLQPNVDLSEEQKRIMQKYLLEGRLNGLELDSDKKEHLKEVRNNIAQEQTKFKNKLEIASKQFTHTITNPEIMKEFPHHIKKDMSTDSLHAEKGPWKVILKSYMVSSFLEYCSIRDLRWNVWQADTRKASSNNDKALDNSTHVESLRRLRRDQATILGYNSFVDMSMETKMAGSIHNVRNVLNTILESARPAQEHEIQSLEEFAAENGFNANLELYDVPYWQRKYRKHHFNYDDMVLREYFPFPKVLNGLFQLCEKLYGIKIIERSNMNTWHKDVRYFDIHDSAAELPLAGFYLDPYTREEEKIFQKSSGWMLSMRNKSKIVDTTPLASLILSLNPPEGNIPSLLSLKEVSILFNKFGHALQHLLSQATYSDVSGLSNIEWDAVGICGHVMSNWLTDKDVLKSISYNHTTEQQLTDDMIHSIIQVNQHMKGFELCREIYLANLDLELHSSKDFWYDVVKRIWPDHIVFPLDKRDAHPCSFSQIFIEQWAAAYYSHIWSKFVAADIFSAFYEDPLEETISTVGKRFRETFLELGGSNHTSELFRRFRGRDPTPKALIKYLGFEKYKNQSSKDNEV